MKKLVGILVVLLAVSFAFSVGVTLSPKITGTLWGHVVLDKDGLDTDLGIKDLELSLGAKVEAVDITLDLTLELPGPTMTLNSFGIENDKAAIYWYKSKSFGYDKGKGLNWFSYYGITKGQTFVLKAKELGVQFATQEATMPGGSDRIALRGAWDILTIAAQTGMSGFGWSGDVIVEAKITPFTNLTVKGGLHAKDLTGAATFNYVVDASYKLEVGLLTLKPYVRYSDTLGQWVGLDVGYEIGVLAIDANVEYDIENNVLATWVQPVISKKGIGWAGIKFGYDYDFAVPTQMMSLGFLVKSWDWSVDPVSIDVYVGSGDFKTKNDAKKTGFGYEIIGDVLADPTDISVYAEAALSLKMANFKPTFTTEGGYYFKDGSKKLELGLSFPIFDLAGLKFDAGVDVFDPADSWYAGIFFSYKF